MRSFNSRQHQETLTGEKRGKKHHKALGSPIDKFPVVLYAVYRPGITLCTVQHDSDDGISARMNRCS